MNRERERRARIAAGLATVAEIAARRIPALPEDVTRIHARQLTRRCPEHDNRPGRRPP